MSGAGAELRAKIELVRPALRSANARLWQTPPQRERYLRYLGVLHGVIRASVPVMAAAVSRCAAMADSTLAPALASYLKAHISEELGHDQWLLEDLAVAGGDPGRVAGEPASAAVAALVGAQYYWLEHFHPVTLLGYIAVLEGEPPEPGLVDDLMAVTGLPRAAFRTLARHAELDPGHSSQVFQLMDDLPLTGVERRALAVSALHTVQLVTQVINGLAAACPGGVLAHQVTGSSYRP